MQGEWLLVTAGHVLLRHLYAPERSNVQCSIYDAWKKGASQHPIPFTLPEKRFALDEDGLDLGLIPLEPIHRRAMEANGIKAFDERVRQPLPPDISRYAVVGLRVRDGSLPVKRLGRAVRVDLAGMRPRDADSWVVPLTD